MATTARISASAELGFAAAAGDDFVEDFAVKPTFFGPLVLLLGATLGIASSVVGFEAIAGDDFAEDFAANAIALGSLVSLLLEESSSAVSSTLGFGAAAGDNSVEEVAANADSLGSFVSLLLGEAPNTLRGVVLACLVLRAVRTAPVLDDTPSVRFETPKSAQPDNKMTAFTPMAKMNIDLNMGHPAGHTNDSLT